MSLEIKKDPFGNINIYKSGLLKGSIGQDGKVSDILKNPIGTHIGGNQYKDNYGFLKTLEELFKFR